MLNKLKYFLFFITSLFFLNIAACSSNSSGNDLTDVKFEVIKEGTISGFTDEKMIVIDNNDDYQKAMAIVYYNLDQMPVVPDVDFNKYTVILAAMGTKNNGGYTIGIDNITKSKSIVTVNLTETSPGKNCVLTDMVSSPYQVIKVKKIKKEIKFNISRNTKDCQ